MPHFKKLPPLRKVFCQTKRSSLFCHTKRTPSLCQTKRTRPDSAPCVYFFKWQYGDNRRNEREMTPVSLDKAAFLRYVATQPSLPGGARGTAVMVNGGAARPGYTEHFVCVSQDEVESGK